ncbi:S-adenosyl-L-methionine-dependent methyltransferase [Aspergillus multicolor]|uniref:class I SAM-dependent methyltransferase n=1 Tax=Aspergillus multicolor TaxID=41759 RepID=UPI003CCD0388
MSEFTEVNRKHFDKVASDHQNDFSELIAAVKSALISWRQWISPKLAGEPKPQGSFLDINEAEEVRLLDYACGSGTVSKALAPYATRTIGLDLSTNMVDEYNKAAREMGYGAERMHAHHFDLLSDSSGPSPPSDVLAKESYDIVATTMALHHVADAAKLLSRLAELFRPGGVCVVVDMVPETESASTGEIENAFETVEALDPSKRGVLETIGKQGFTEAEMRSMYEEAGMWRGFEYVVLPEELHFTLFGRSFAFPGFVARGVKV